MNDKVASRRANKSARELGSGERVARKARNDVWTRTISFLRRYKLPLVGLFLFPFLSSLPLSLLVHGAARWAFIGAVGATSFWLVVVFVILWSGIAPSIMGIQGESLTADILREFKGREWHLINGMRFPDSGDIDHILVGPSGIIIFETKWSSGRWPMKYGKRNYMSNQLDWAVTQVKKNREDVQSKFESVRDYVPIYAVCVLWSAEDSSSDLPTFYRKSPDFVYGVRGPELKSWLEGLRKNALDPHRVKEIASEMQEKAKILDVETPERHRRTLNRIIVDSMFLPILAFISPLWAVGAISLLKNGYMDLGSLPILCVMGLYIRSRTRLKMVTVCWFSSLGVVVAYLLVHEILFLLR